MDQFQQQIINKCRLNFLKISARHIRVDIQDKSLLVSNITQLLGIYALGYDKQLHLLLKDMIRLGEHHNLVMGGQRMQFDALNRKYKMPVDEPQIVWKAEFIK